MNSNQQALEYVSGLMSNGMSVSEANVELVRMEGVRLVSGSIPREIRSALMVAVKAGRLGRLPRQGVKPEAFFHPNAEFRAKEERNKIANASIRALLAVCA